MCSNKEARYSHDELKQFANELIEDYKEKLLQLEESKKIYINDIFENEALINTLDHNKKNSDLFSPNSKDVNIEFYYKEIEKGKKLITETEDEENRLKGVILHLKEIHKTLANQELPNINSGLNILNLQEQDRQRISRDLHDSTVQNLASLIHKCDLCSKLVDIDPVRTRLELNTMTNTLKAVINEIRETIFNLKPMSLDDLGLLATVNRYADQLMMYHDIDVRLRHNEEIDEILPVIKLSLFRLIQEACNNAVKHAEAKSIEIDIMYNINCINLSIKDDGKGFNLDTRKDTVTNDNCGYGLSIMNERVLLLSGSMKIQSIIKKGTKISITVPIRSEGKKR